MKRLVELVKDNWTLSLTAFFTLLSLVSFAVVQYYDMLFIYDDGVSYLTIARSVFDGQQAGVEQMGHIWLPLNHILKLPFIWNDFLYQSGLAGSIISMASYVALCLFVYKSALHLSKSRKRATIAAILCALNPTLLFLQATPMSEVPFMAMFMISVYGFIRYIDSRSIRSLALLGLVNAGLIMLRYEGWFVVLIEVLMVLVMDMFQKRMSRHEMLTRTIILVTPVALAATAWLLWNYKLTGDPIAFLRSDFSASAFTERQKQFGVSAEGDIITSILLYLGASAALIGMPAIVAAMAGQVSWLLTWKPNFIGAIKRIDMSIVRRAAIFIALLGPVIFHILTLLTGQSAMRVAGFAGDVTSLNIRYGIFLLPYAAIGVSLIAKKLSASVLAGVVVLVSYVLMANSVMPIITDATEGQINYVDAATVLRNNIQEGEEALVSMSANSAFTFHSQLPLDTYIHEGVYSEWQSTLDDPNQVEWVIKSRRVDFDELSELDAEDELKDFFVFYDNSDIIIFRKIVR